MSRLDAGIRKASVKGAQGVRRGVFRIQGDAETLSLAVLNLPGHSSRLHRDIAGSRPRFRCHPTLRPVVARQGSDAAISMPNRLHRGAAGVLFRSPLPARHLLGVGPVAAAGRHPTQRRQGLRGTQRGCVDEHCYSGGESKARYQRYPTSSSVSSAVNSVPKFGMSVPMPIGDPSSQERLNRRSMPPVQSGRNQGSVSDGHRASNQRHPGAARPDCGFR